MIFRKQPQSVPAFVIAGLGNPGLKYEGSRHNAGFDVADTLAARLGVKIKKLKFQALYGEGVIAGRRVILLKPQTFMNLSGRSVRDCLNFYKLPLEKAIIIYDDISLPPGKIRVRPKGSDGGHNGIKDIIYHGHSDVFPRVRVGVGSPPNPGFELTDWVLSGYSAQERKLMDGAFVSACDAVEHIIEHNILSAMNKYNSKATS